jgi:Membrane-associated lipoprotein involved in thiamine biosynthesis
MGTLGRASWGPGDPAIGERLVERVAGIEERLTRFRPDSEVSLLSQTWRGVSVDAAAVLSAAEALHRSTGGAFNALLGARMRTWEAVVADRGAPGLGAPVGSRVPQGPCAVVGRIEVEGAADGASVVRRARVVGAEPGSVDLGAIAKGYAADQLRDLACRSGARDVLVSLGRSSMALAGAPALIGLASPWEGLGTFGTLVLEQGSLSVSADPGTPVRSGRRRSHVLDPLTGRSALTDLCAAVVCGPDGMACEAFSTAFLAMGLDEALLLDRRHPEIRSVLMTVDGRVLADPRLEMRALPGVQDWLRGQAGPDQ